MTSALGQRRGTQPGAAEVGEGLVVALSDHRKWGFIDEAGAESEVAAVHGVENRTFRRSDRDRHHAVAECFCNAVGGSEAAKRDAKSFFRQEAARSAIRIGA